MRNLVLALLLLNLAFFAYAAWIDQPDPSPAEVNAPLPRLLLASEFPSTERAASAGAALPSGRPAEGSQAASSSPACVAVGPFSDNAVATRAASVLKDRGFDPKEKGVPGEITDGYWVHVENIASAAEQTRLMRSLEQASLSDASPLTSADQTRHISVGIFSERGRAERRAAAVKRLGIEAEVSPRKRAGTVYWLEMTAKAEPNAVSTEGIVPAGGEPLEIRACITPQGTAPTAKR